MTFPDFMFRDENRIPASQQNTPDIEGCYYTASVRDEQKNLTEYIRHQIHHPENHLNTRYTKAELRQALYRTILCCFQMEQLVCVWMVPET